MTIAAKIEWTKDYSKFKMLSFNRPIDEQRVDRIGKVIAEDGFLVPILVNQDFYIIDGQHRYVAIQPLGIEIGYIQYHLDNDKLPLVVSKLNSTARTWKIFNYLHMWADLGKAHYVWMKKVMDEYDIPFVNFYRLISATTLQFTIKFRAGTIEFTDSQKNRILERIKWFNEIRMAETRFSEFGTGFAAAIASFVSSKGYDHKLMMEAVKKYPGSLIRCRVGAEYSYQLNDIYNRIAPINKKLKGSKVAI